MIKDLGTLQSSYYSASVEFAASSPTLYQSIALSNSVSNSSIDSSVIAISKRSLEGIDLLTKRRPYTAEQVVPLRMPYAWDQSVINQVSEKITSFVSKENTPIDLDQFFKEVASLKHLPFDITRVLSFLDLFDVNLVRSNLFNDVFSILTKELIFNGKLFILSVSQVEEFDYCLEKTDNSLNNQVLYLSLDSKTDDARMEMALFLNTFHGEIPLVVAGESIKGAKLKEIMAILCNTFFTQALINDEAKLDLGTGPYSRYSLTNEPDCSFNLSIWLLLARKNPHTFYGSVGFEPYTLADRTTVLNRTEIFNITFQKEFYNSAITFVRNISTSQFSKCIVNSEEVEEFSKLVKSHDAERDSLTLLAQKVDKTRHEAHMVFLNVMFNLLRPLKKVGNEGYIWLALRTIKEQHYHISKPPFEPVFAKKSDEYFPALAKQEIANSGEQSIEEFGKKFFRVDGEDLIIPSRP